VQKESGKIVFLEKTKYFKLLEVEVTWALGLEFFG
jgi:hypothetical protein